jgi:hypothetical protein
MVSARPPLCWHLWSDVEAWIATLAAFVVTRKTAKGRTEGAAANGLASLRFRRHDR